MIDRWRHGDRAAGARGRSRRAAAALTVAAACAAALAPVGLAGTASAAVPTGPFSVNVDNREDVRQFYNLVHEASEGVPVGWTGSVADCNPGTVSPDFLAASLSRINYFRAMAGTPAVTLTDENNATAQAAALVQSANNGLDHNPPSIWTCWTPQAADGAARSNLAAGGIGPQAVGMQMYDGSALGHRRNLLNPSITTIGVGSVPATPGFRSSDAQLVLTTPLPERPPVRTGFVAWPPQGFVPYQVVYPRWSFSLPNADFSAATVTMQRNGAAVPVEIRCADPNVAQTPNCGQFGEPAIIWTPNGLADGASWPKPAADDPYEVTIGNVMVGGVAQAPFTYTVTVIDPAVSDAAHTVSQAPQGPASPAVGSNPTYAVSAVADASGYQWRTTSLTPGDLADGAEDGLANFTASVSPAYDRISTARKATGDSSFRLAAFGSDSPPQQQTLTLNRTLLAGATSSLTFDSLYWSLLNQSARVEVSLDGGLTWQSAFQEDPPWAQQDTSFATKTVPLGQFAGRQIQVRFSLTFAGGNWALGTVTDEPNGWYVDNVTLSNVQNAAVPVLTEVVPNPSFVFANPAEGAVAIDVRPQFSNPSFGSAFGEWSPTLVVTSVRTASATTLASSANPSIGGQEVTYTATVAPTDNGGTVAFADNGTVIAGCEAVALTAEGQATCRQTYALGGSASIVAAYSGDAAFLGSASPALSQVILAPTPTTGTLVSSDRRVLGGQPVTFTATVTPPGGSGTVSFTNNGVVITDCGAVPLTPTGEATCTMTHPGPERNSLIDAVYSGDATFQGSHLGSVLQSVIAQTSTSLVSSANPSTAGQQVTYTATVTPGDVFGTVTFDDNGQTIPGCGSVNLDVTGTATCTVTYTEGGAHSIQAYYSEFGMASSFAPSASPVLSQEVAAQ